jgi:GDP/UDP-N,N'-diacetylbacillosamine 2-epimerase (hydrolysing)
MIPMMRKVCVFTGTRADYGLLKPLLHAIKSHPDLTLQLIVSGMHLKKRYGSTYKEIQKDGFTIDASVKILGHEDHQQALCDAMARGLTRYAAVFNQLQPDILVVLGDRFEALSIASTALIYRLPIAHIHGGEATFGVIDEAIRHAITKMAHLHFTATEVYRQRVIQLGEHPTRVFNVGSLGIEHIEQLSLLTREALSTSLNFNLDGTIALATYHPETLSSSNNEHIKSLIAALDTFKDLKVVFTYANADTGGTVINDCIDEYVKKNSQRACCYASLGQHRYLSMLNIADFVIGNSSSGIIEAPHFKTPTVNIGTRQEGRLQALSTINCAHDTQSIIDAISTALSKTFINSLKTMTNPYRGEAPSKTICSILTTTHLDDIVHKSFYDIPFTIPSLKTIT